LSAERDWYLDQYNSLDALVDALWNDNWWLEYWLWAMQDELLDQGAQTAEGASTVYMVEAALLARDEALLKAREDLAAMQVVAAERETTLPSAQAQLQQDCATLEGRDLGSARPRRRPKRPSGWGSIWQTRLPRLP
jgi:hypothetical protein